MGRIEPRLFANLWKHNPKEQTFEKGIFLFCVSGQIYCITPIALGNISQNAQDVIQ